jgi:hypothetical protein
MPFGGPAARISVGLRVGADGLPKGEHVIVKRLQIGSLAADEIFTYRYRIMRDPRMEPIGQHLAQRRSECFRVSQIRQRDWRAGACPPTAAEKLGMPFGQDSQDAENR